MRKFGGSSNVPGLTPVQLQLQSPEMGWESS